MSRFRPGRGAIRVLVLSAVLGVGAFAASVAFAAILTGTDDSETITGTNSSDIINLKAGFDTAIPRGGLDEVSGGDGGDTLCQSAGDDVLVGDDGNDGITDATAAGMGALGGVCFGVNADISGGDADVLLGKRGNDTLFSADNDALDVLDGGAGHDICFVDQQDLIRGSCEEVFIP